MATTPTLPLFDEPATPSQKPSPDDSSTSTDDVPEEERIAHIDQRRSRRKLFGDPVADLNRGWWETLTLTDAMTALARYEREAQQSQSLAADLDPFEDDPFATDDDKFWDSAERRADDRW